MSYVVWLYLLLCASTLCAQPADTLWMRLVGGAADETITATCQDGNGGFVLAGYCGFNGDEMGPQNFFVARTDSSGTSLWMTELGLADTNEFAYAVTVTANGDIVIAGGDVNYSPALHRAHLARLSSEGDVVWDRTYAGVVGTLCFNSIAELPNGNLAAAGDDWTEDNNCDAYLVTLNPNGDTLWTRSFGDSSLQRITDLTVTADGDLILCGNAWDELNENNLVLLLRVDADGNLLWMHTYDDSSEVLNFTGQDVAVMTNGDLAVSGACYADRMEIYLLRTDADGGALWAHTYSFDNYTTEAADLAAASDGGTLVASMVGSYPSYHIVLMKADASGDLVWQFPFMSEHFSMVISGVMETADHGCVMAGTYFDAANHADGLLIKTQPEVSGAHDIVPYPAVFSLSAFPNPFNPNTTITFVLPEVETVKLAVFDVTGREVCVLANKNYPAGKHSVSIDGSALPSGIYFAHLSAGAIQKTQKLLLVK